MLYLLQTVDFDYDINAILLNSHTHSNLVSLIISSKLQSSLAADFLQSTMRSRKISKYYITGQMSVSIFRRRIITLSSPSTSSSESTTA